jgi:hypothetical protein
MKIKKFHVVARFAGDPEGIQRQPKAACDNAKIQPLS